MKSLLRRNLLLLMLGVTSAAYTFSVETPAFAKNGGDDSSDSGSSGSSDSGNSGNDGDDSSGSGSGGGDDNSGSGSNDSSSDDNDSGGGDSDDDFSNRSAGNDDRKLSGGNKAVRPEIELSVDSATRAGLLNGSLVAVDNLGRALEVEADIRNGRSVVTAKPHGGDAKRNPGAIAGFNVVPAAQAPAHQ